MRDILYLDQDLLASYYAQAFQGVTEKLAQGKYASKASTEGASSKKGSDSFAAEVALASIETESKILHDYMLTLLEQKLTSDTIVLDAAQISEDCTSLLKSPLVQASGIARIEDYSRLIQLISEFNELVESVAYFNFQSAENQAMIKALEDAAANLTGSAKSEAMKQVKAVKSPKRYRDAMGWTMEDQFLDHLHSFLITFKKGALDITVRVDGSETSCRAVLDAKWLRVNPEILREMFGSQIQGEVTLLGQVTWVAGSVPDTTPGEISGADIRSAIMRILHASEGLEQTISRSEEHPELTFRPLAIYRSFASKVVSV